MKGDLKFFRSRWWGVYVLIPALLLSIMPILLISFDNFSKGNIVGAIVGFVVSSVCFLLCLALYAPHTFFIAFKIIGLAIFIGYLGYAIDELQNGHLYSSSKSEASFVNALIGLFVFGLPGLSLFIKAKKPEESPYDESGNLLDASKDWHNLLSVVLNGDFAEAKKIIEHSPHLLIETNVVGQTLLHYLSLQNKEKEVSWLFDHGASLNTQDIYGVPPLFEISALEYQDLVLWFLKNGADLTIEDDDEQNIYEYLTNNGFESGAEFIRKNK